jgi:hypothetical protein
LARWPKIQEYRKKYISVAWYREQVRWTLRVNHWTNKVKFTTNTERWKEEDIEPGEDLLG